MTTRMRALLWTVAQHKYGWTNVDRHRGGLQVADALVARGFVTYSTLHGRETSTPRLLVTDQGMEEIRKRWPVSPFVLGTYAPQPGGWTPVEGAAGSMSAGCEHVAAMRAAVDGKGDCPVCEREDQVEQAQQEAASAASREQKLVREEVEEEAEKPKRKTTGEVVEITATCAEDGCGWAKESKNCMGLAAQHHDRTGHTVSVEQHQRVVFGDPAEAKPQVEPEAVF